MEYQARQIIYGLLPSDLIAHSVQQQWSYAGVMGFIAKRIFSTLCNLPFPFKDNTSKGILGLTFSIPSYFRVNSLLSMLIQRAAYNKESLMQWRKISTAYGTLCYYSCCDWSIQQAVLRSPLKFVAVFVDKMSQDLSPSVFNFYSNLTSSLSLTLNCVLQHG